MDTTIQPIFLLADSQLLFLEQDGELFLERARRLLEPASPRAAYVGASNGDAPEFYELFVGAMDGIGVDDCRMIPSEPSAEDLDFLDQADLILLAGGDVERGFSTFEKNGLKPKIGERYQAGALLIGISAGAVQIGLRGCREGAPDEEIDFFDTFGLIPFLIDAHQEPEWERLTRMTLEVGGYIQGLGIPSGGGAIVHPDMTVEPARRPLVELSAQNGELRRSLIWPPDDASEPYAKFAGEGTPQ